VRAPRELRLRAEAPPALKEYEASLKNARCGCDQLARLTRHADGDREELRDLKKQLASKQ